jgi:hypothetical protein
MLFGDPMAATTRGVAKPTSADVTNNKNKNKNKLAESGSKGMKLKTSVEAGPGLNPSSSHKDEKEALCTPPVSQPVSQQGRSPDSNIPHTCTRGALKECSERAFKDDLKKLWKEASKARKARLPAVRTPKGGQEEYASPILNGRKLDVFNLYKEVVFRGGFFNSAGINWSGQVSIYTPYTYQLNYKTLNPKTLNLKSLTLNPNPKP